MNKFYRYFATILLIAMCLIALTACTGNNNPADDDIAVTTIKLNKGSLTLEVGASEKLTVSVEPTNATDRTVSWSTSNATVATVSDGTVTAVATGTAVITAKAGDKSAVCTVTVNQPVTRTVTKEEWKVALDKFFAEANDFSAQFENQVGGLPMEEYDFKITDSVLYCTMNIDDVKGVVCMLKTETGESERVTSYMYNDNLKQWFQTTYDWNPSTGKEIDEEVAMFKEEYIQPALLLYLAVFNDSDEETMDLAYSFFDQCTFNSETDRYEAITHVEDAPDTTLKFAFGFENKVLTYLDLTLDLTIDDVTENMVKLHVYDVGVTKQDESLLPDLLPAKSEVSGMTEEQWKVALNDFFENCNNYSLMTRDLPIQDGDTNGMLTQLCNKDVIYLEAIDYNEKTQTYILRREGSFEEFIFDNEKNEWRSCGATDNGEEPDDAGTFFDNILQGSKDQLRIISNGVIGAYLSDAFEIFEYDVKEKTFVVYSARVGGFIQVKFVDGALSSITIESDDMLFKIYDIGTTVVNVPFEQPVHYTLTEAEWKVAFEDFEKNCQNFSYAMSMDGMSDNGYITEQYLYGTSIDSDYESSACIVKRSYGWELYCYDSDEGKWRSIGPNTGGDGIESNIEGMFEQYYTVWKELLLESLSDILAQEEEFTTFAEIATVLYDKCTYNETTKEYECDIPQDEGVVEHIRVIFGADKALSAVGITAINGEQKNECLSFYNIGTTEIEETDLPFDVNESDAFVKALSEAIQNDEIIETLVEYFRIRPDDIPNDVKFSAMFSKCIYNDVEKRYEYTRTSNNGSSEEEYVYVVYIALDENNNLSYIRAFKQHGEVISEEINIDNNGTYNVNF